MMHVLDSHVEVEAMHLSICPG